MKAFFSYSEIKAFFRYPPTLYLLVVHALLMLLTISIRREVTDELSVRYVVFHATMCVLIAAMIYRAIKFTVKIALEEVIEERERRMNYYEQ